MVDVVDVQQIARANRKSHGNSSTVTGVILVETNIFNPTFDNRNNKLARLKVLRRDVGPRGYKASVKIVPIQPLQRGSDEFWRDAASDLVRKHQIDGVCGQNG